MLQSFSQAIDAFCAKTKIKPALVLKKLAFDALRGVMLKSPVDTGRFRANWRVSLNTPDLTYTLVGGKVDDATGTVPGVGNVDTGGLATGNNTIAAAKFGDAIWITNNLPYAERLENGWSKQAPNGMLKLTFEEVKQSFMNAVKSIGAA